MYIDVEREEQNAACCVTVMHSFLISHPYYLWIFVWLSMIERYSCSINFQYSGAATKIQSHEYFCPDLGRKGQSANLHVHSFVMSYSSLLMDLHVIKHDQVYYEP